MNSDFTNDVRDAREIDTNVLVQNKWWSKCLEPTTSLTTMQYLFIALQSVGSSIVCFGANFALVTLAFLGKPDPLFWEFPTSIVTSYALTIILEVIVNWFISNSLLSLDVLNGRIAPLDPRCLSWWPQNGSRLHGYLNTSDLVLNTVEPTSLSKRCYWHFQRTGPWILLGFVFLLPLFCGITYLLFGASGYSAFPQVEWLVGLLGSALALLTMPFWALITLAHIGERMLEDRKAEEMRHERGDSQY